ncbi:MAG TPA: response regulator transcription factor [Syntrophomonadaceae bacterium]|nr:response regulator transcription factor [Syntrophomonadaceae bacterium]
MRLVLIDDHPLVIQGILAVVQNEPDMEVVGTATSGGQGLCVLKECQPDVAIVDMRLPGEYGLDIIKKGRTVAEHCRFIVLTSFSERGDIKRAMTEKVEGYVLKEATPEEIISAIRLVGKGRNYIDPAIMQNIMSSPQDDPIEHLTPREMEVLEALARGMSNRDIADSLYVTEYTVKKHVSQILDKLSLVDRTQAALYAVSKGLGQPLTHYS